MSRKILIVEDDVVISTDLKITLENTNQEVIGICETGEDAVNLSEKKKPDAVIMDIGLKGKMNGIEASQKILNLDIPVIYTTASKDMEVFEKANIIPAYGFITKPFGSKKLTVYVELAINKKESERKRRILIEKISKECQTKDQVKEKLKDVDKYLYERLNDQKIKLAPEYTKPEILVVEDDTIISLTIKMKLEEKGYTVISGITTGEEALKVIEKHNPDLIVMDIKLKGGITGIEVSEQIKDLDIPIIYLTGNDDVTFLIKALETTPDAYLLKPFENQELQYAVTLALKKHYNEINILLNRLLMNKN